nr:unnamed protein product [Digitaria exilis]
MDDPSLFMEWAMMETLQQEHLAPASGNDDGCQHHHDRELELRSAAASRRHALGRRRRTRPAGDGVRIAAGEKSRRLKSVGSMYAQEHIIAERKRREKINQRFVELSTVIPGLKKMDKATILSDATRYVKELQEKLKELENGSNNDRSIESWVLVKKTCVTVPDEGSSPPSWTSSGTAATSRKPLPEIEVRFLEEKSVVVRIHCEDGKGVAVRVLTEVDELHLNIIHANVMPFLASTLIITITAKASCHFAFI